MERIPRWQYTCHPRFLPREIKATLAFHPAAFKVHTVLTAAREDRLIRKKNLRLPLTGGGCGVTLRFDTVPKTVMIDSHDALPVS